MKVRAYGQMLSIVMKDTEHVFPLLEHVGKVRALAEEPDNSLRYTFRRLHRHWVAWDAMKKSPLVKDWREFRVGALGPLADDYASLLEGAVAAIRNQQGSDGRRGFVTKLQGVTPQTFGTGLLIAMIGDDDPRQAVFAHLGAHLDTIRKADPSRRAELMGVVRGILKDRRRSSFAPEGRPAQAFDTYYSQAVGRDDLGKLVEVFMATQIQRRDVRDYLEEASKLITSLVIKHPDKAEAIYAHTIKTAKQHIKRRGASYSINAIETPEVLLLARMARDVDEGGRELLKFLWQKLQAKDVDPNVTWMIDNVRWQPRRLLEGPFTKITKKRDELVKAGVAPAEAKFQAYVAVLTETAEFFGPVHVADVDEVVSLGGLTSKQRAAAAKAIAAGAGKLPLLNAVVGQIEATLPEYQKARKLPESLANHYLGVLRDESLSTAWRVATFTEVCENFGDRKGLDLKQANSECPERGGRRHFLGAKSAPQPRAA